MQILCVFLFSSAFSRDLSRMSYDDSDPNLRVPLPLGQAQDVYLHYDLDPTLFEQPSKSEQELVDYLMGLTDVMNMETFNPVNFNLVTSSFSINSKDTDRYVMQEFLDQKVMHEGEAHIWLHVTDYVASSIAGRFGLYDGADRSYAIAAVFNANGYTHTERTNAAHEIGHLFGLDHTHVLSLSYNDVDVNPDLCGGGPNGADCSTKPAIGGSLMSYCQECPDLATHNGGGFKSARPLTSFHPYQAEKIQEHFDQYKHVLPNISRQKLRTFISDAARSNLCAREGQTCSCNGVVYFGPTLSSSNPEIFGVEHVTGSVRCSSGADETFADVFHGKSKSCYCDQGASLYDITYVPTDVDFINAGVGECVIEGCDVTKRCYWDEYTGPDGIGYFTISGQPEWKCKQECLDRNGCNAFNFKNGNCRLFEHAPSTVSNSGMFRGSTCWKRPNTNLHRFPQPAHQIRNVIVSGGGNGNGNGNGGDNNGNGNGNGGDDNGNDGEDNDDEQYVMLDNGELCPSEESLIRTQTECLHAISMLSLETLTQAWSGYNNKKPAGCSFHSQQGKVHYNTNFGNGVGTAKNNLAPICKVINDNPAVWSNWGSWSSCSLDCGGGIQTQYRTCLSGPCIGANSRTQTCNNHACSSSVTCEYVAIPSHQCPSGSLPTCGNGSPGSLCKASLSQNGVPFVINNCGDSDVFRYTCTDNGNGSGNGGSGENGSGNGGSGEGGSGNNGSSGHSYTDFGLGICKSAQGYSVRGLAKDRLTPDECKAVCDSFHDCAGYSTTTRTRGMCYVHGPYTYSNKPDDSWGTSSGEDYTIDHANGLDSMQCYVVA